jgi:Putative auto-transporter adhesin, head GIN domain
MTKLILAILMVFIATIANAQLRGSGKTITKTYDYQNFDKLSFQDLDGTIEVELGKEFSISVTIDDNLFPLLSFEENNSKNELKLFFKNNANNKKYIEDTNCRIKITTPKLLEVKHSGNSTLVISNLIGTNFKLDNSGNGTTKISGSIETLEVINRGNGNTKAEQLLSKNAVIKCSGNGNVYVTVSNTLTAKASGNCSVINYGKAPFDSQSSKSGNARLLNSALQNHL